MQGEEILRPAIREDAPDWHRWRSEGCDSFVDGLPFPFESHVRWFEGKLTDPRTRLWTVLWEERPAGMMGLTEIDHRQQTAELAWVYVEPGARGCGSAAVREVLRLGFRELNLHRIHLSVLAGNARAMRCYAKVGFREEGRLREAVFKDGERRDLVLMALLRPEFER
jgi:RimJ/RimL family protein N-acetyltransferase